MIRVVLDTNVIVSGTFWTGAAYQVLKLVDEGRLEMFISKPILKEYLETMQGQEILEKTNEQQHAARIAAVQKLLLKATVIEPEIRLQVVKDDPDDDKILEAAITANVQYIVTKDKHLLKLRSYQNIPILTQEEFLAIARK